MKDTSAGVVGALFGDLDDADRRRFGLAGASVVASARPAVGLRDLTIADLRAILGSTLAQVGTDRVMAVAGGITFFALLALFPALTALVSIYGLVADPATIAGHLDLLESFLPLEALDLVRGQIEAIAGSPGTALSLAGVVSLLVAFYSANGGMRALLSALNVAFYQNETRGFVRLNLVSMAFTLGSMVLIVAMLGAIAVIPALIQMLPMADAAAARLAWLRWPVMFGVLILALAALYRWGPDAPPSRWRWISPGAVTAAVGLVVTSILFSWYAANFADYNETYGSLGAVVALMMWLWFASTVVLIGAEINSEIEAHLRRMAGAPPLADLAGGSAQR